MISIIFMGDEIKQTNLSANQLYLRWFSSKRLFFTDSGSFNTRIWIWICSIIDIREDRRHGHGQNKVLARCHGWTVQSELTDVQERLGRAPTESFPSAFPRGRCPYWIWPGFSYLINKIILNEPKSWVMKLHNLQHQLKL